MPGIAQLVDQAVLMAAGYDVVTVSQPQAVDSWLSTFLADDLLIIFHPSATDALDYSAEILETHPCLPIILIANEANQSFLKKALEIGIFDYLPYPVESSTLLLSVKRSLVRQNSWQEWNRFARVLADLEDGIIIADLDGYLLMINRSAQRIFSVGEVQPEGKTVGEVFHHPDLLDIFNSQNIFPHLRKISLGVGVVFRSR